MNFLSRILAFDVPENARLSSWELRPLTIGWPVAVVVLFLILFGILGVAFCYFFLEKGTLGWPRRLTLVGLRCALLLLLLFLIMRPMLLVEFTGQRPQGVVVLIDNSQSMTQRDRRTNADKMRVDISTGRLPLDAKIVNTRQPKKPAMRITTAKATSGSAITVTSADHDLRTGDTVTITGNTLPAANGTFVVAKIDAGSFSLNGTSSAAAGEGFGGVWIGANPRRLDVVANILHHPDLKLIHDLQKFGPLRPAFFGQDVRWLQDDNQDIARLIADGYKADQNRTALADSIVKIVQSKDSASPSAIVVITDGQDNGSKFTLLEAAEECKRANVPLHIFGVGSADGNLLQIKEFGAPDTLFVEDFITVPLRWRAVGFKKGVAEITLKLDGKTVKLDGNLDSKKFKIATGEDLRDVLNFSVPKSADKKENQDLIATIKYKADDGETVETSMKRTVRVADSKIKILYIENLPRWEFKFLQPALVNRFKKRCEVEFILINAAREVANGGPPYLPEFFKTREKFKEKNYNLIILGDVPSSYFSPEQQGWIEEFVQNRGGLIVMAGRQNMPSSYARPFFDNGKEKPQPIAAVLPIEFKAEKFPIDSDKPTTEYFPLLTDDGWRTDWLMLADTPEESREVWEKKLGAGPPPAEGLGFHWHYPIVKLRPAATALVVNPRVKFGEPPADMPILATQMYGKGQVLWVGSDETWRWRWNYADKYFDRLWGQIIYQLGLPSLLGDSAKRSQMALDRSKAVVGEESKIYVTLLDKDYNPRKDQKVEAELEHMDAKAGEERKRNVTLNALPSRPGEYIVSVPHRRAGNYELRVKNPDVSTFSFNVELPPKHELEESGMAEKALREAAQYSGGRFYREEDLSKLAGNIEPKKTPFTRRQEVLLWNPLAILLFLGLITMEWLVRKFSDLT